MLKATCTVYFINSNQLVGPSFLSLFHCTVLFYNRRKDLEAFIELLTIKLTTLVIEVVGI